MSRTAVVYRFHVPGGGDYLAVESESTDWEPLAIPGTHVGAGEPINRTLAIKKARECGWLTETEEVGS